MAEKKKWTAVDAGTAVAAVLLAAALALGGTFAMQNLGEDALSERESYINPGGRLHYDFSGWQSSPHNEGILTEDIYVENFGSEPIFARVRLDEYMEIGEDAGMKPEEKGYDNKMAAPLVSGAKIDDKTTWTTHLPASTDAGMENGSANGSKTDFHIYWDWVLGGEAEDNPEGKTVYMPTFNKNNDSLAPDINGTMEGGYADARVQYDDWVRYEVGDSATRVRSTDPSIPDGAFYDADDNNDDEGNGSGYGNGGIPGDHYDVAEETHVAQETLPGGVCTMAQWQNMSKKQKEAHGWWVYDVDGWAYWSQAIQPGVGQSYTTTATGLLLDRVEPTAALKSLGQKWYYAIHAVGQFITADDLGRDDGTGFYYTTADGTPTGYSEPTEDAYGLLKEIGVQTTVGGTLILTDIDADTDTNYVQVGGNYKVTPEFKLKGEHVPAGYFSVTVTDANGTVVAETDPGMRTIFTVESTWASPLTITAVEDRNELYQSVEVPITTEREYVKSIVGTGKTVFIGGYEWYALTVKNGLTASGGETKTGALLLSKDVIMLDAFDTGGGTDLFASSLLTDMAALASSGGMSGKAVTMEAAVSGGGSTSYQMFLLSEADVYGGAGDGNDDYTAGGKLTIPGGLIADYTDTSADPVVTAPTAWWLRTADGAGKVKFVASDGNVGSEAPTSNSIGVRPAVWYDITPVTYEVALYKGGAKMGETATDGGMNPYTGTYTAAATASDGSTPIGTWTWTGTEDEGAVLTGNGDSCTVVFTNAFGSFGRDPYVLTATFTPDDGSEPVSATVSLTISLLA